MIRWGMALSGGGVRGGAHIGVIRAMEEIGLRPEALSGSSAGACVAGLYACGLGWRELVEQALILARGKRWLDFDFGRWIATAVRLALAKGIAADGIFKGDRLERYFEMATNGRTLQNVTMPLALHAVDINAAHLVTFLSRVPYASGDEETVLRDATVAEAIRASISIPAVFRPKMLNGLRLVDGGVLANLPVYALRNLGAQRVLAVNVGYQGDPRPAVDDVIEISLQTINVMNYQLSKYQQCAADYVLDIDMGQVGTLEFDQLERCIEAGYLAAKRALPEICKALSLDACTKISYTAAMPSSVPEGLRLSGESASRPVSSVCGCAAERSMKENEKKCKRGCPPTELNKRADGERSS